MIKTGAELLLQLLGKFYKSTKGAPHLIPDLIFLNIYFINFTDKGQGLRLLKK